MSLNRVKNFIITFFVLLAIYQTAKLWFEDFSNHNFFYSFKSIQGGSVNDYEVSSLIENIVVGKGSNKFFCDYNNSENKEYKNIFEQAIRKSLENGNYIGKEDINVQENLTGKIVIYNYSFFINSEDINYVFNIKSNISNKIKRFNKIMIIPDISTNENLKIAFLDTEENLSYLVELRKNDIINSTIDAINNFKTENEDFYYISSIQNGFDIFKTNIFIPRWIGNSIGYKPIIMSNPLESDGGVLLNQLEKDINMFFDNPAAKWPSKINDVFTYSDENTVVKYYTNGVLEYSNYKSSNDNLKEIKFSKCYKTALSFLKKDTNIKNEYYLKDYKKEDDRITFYFEYKINNFPIILSDELKSQIGMNSIIEISATNSKVLKYKKYVYEFSIDETEIIFAETDFLEAIDNIFLLRQNNSKEREKIDNISLSYTAEKGTNKIYLKWFININDNSYIVSSSK